ncbi:MAG: hypothetical protein ACLFTI_06570 [Anaerolineales bacterium]
MMAYIDPNTGGMLFQALAAAFALFSGFMLIFSRQIRAGFARFKRFIRQSFGNDTETEDVNPEASSD